ncbi:MAG: biotin--[acetyl-CoA-carboxylase] ligase [Pirellulaceae bacterium]|nr:biotin--[acetyl-CoA-carboxylase] ligase [Planctomycetaceae bacterium]
MVSRLKRNGDEPADIVTRLREATFIRSVKVFETMESTNTWSLANSFSDVQLLPELVWAKAQTGGRGRGSNRWHSTMGALTFSIALQSARVGKSPEDLPKIALLAGLAVQAAIQPIVSGDDVRVKWPNDVYVSDRKIAGILVETPSRPSASAVVGIGLNVCNSLDDAPDEVEHRGVSLAQLVSEPLDLNDVLLALIVEFENQWNQFEGGVWNLAQQWSRVCYLNGKRVELRSGDRRWQGVVRGIAEDGALQLETVPGHVEPIYAGQVTVME